MRISSVSTLHQKQPRERGNPDADDCETILDEDPKATCADLSATSMFPDGYGGGCDACGQPDEGYMLHDDLWDVVVRDGERYLCFDCVRRRLGRPLYPADFMDVPLSAEYRPRSPAAV